MDTVLHTVVTYCIQWDIPTKVAVLQDRGNNSYSHTQELMLTSTLITPLQLGYGMLYSAVLLKHLTLIYLSNMLMLAG